jgi:hypothetical protein
MRDFPLDCAGTPAAVRPSRLRTAEKTGEDDMARAELSKLVIFGMGLVIAAGCVAEPLEEQEAAPAADEPTGLDWDLDEDVPEAPVCPPEDPECDGLESACVFEEDEPQAEASGPGLQPTGVSDPLTSSGQLRVWPRGEIPYAFERDAAGNIKLDAGTRETLSRAMTEWQTKSENRLRFRPKTSNDTAYVLIKPGNTLVRPFVGYRPGRVQELILSKGEYITVMRHELGHVIGLHHEQKRSDRLNHIRVVTSNIANSDHCRYQFSACSDCAKIGPYDVMSVMQYRTSDLKGCRTGPVLLHKDGSRIDHHWSIRSGDLDTVARMYGAQPAPAPTPTPTPEAIPSNGSLAASGLCADVAGGSTADGAKLLGWGCHGGDNQDWRITKNRQLKVKHSTKCARVSSGGLVTQASCSSTADSQKWKFSNMEIVNGKTGGCLEVPNGSYFAGQIVAFQACNGSARQKFNYRADTEELKAGGFCLTPKGGASAGNDVVLAACDGRTSQKWFQARGGFVNRANLSQCLRVEGGPTSGTKVEVSDCNDKLGQRWALRGEVRQLGSGLCLKTAGSGAQLAVATCNGSAAQRWTFWSR